jgi:hypothetical protein
LTRDEDADNVFPVGYRAQLYDDLASGWTDASAALPRGGLGGH